MLAQRSSECVWRKSPLRIPGIVGTIPTLVWAGVVPICNRVILAPWRTLPQFCNRTTRAKVSILQRTLWSYSKADKDEGFTCTWKRYYHYKMLILSFFTNYTTACFVVVFLWRPGVCLCWTVAYFVAPVLFWHCDVLTRVVFTALAASSRAILSCAVLPHSRFVQLTDSLREWRRRGFKV